MMIRRRYFVIMMITLMIVTYRDFYFIRWLNVILISGFSGVQSRIRLGNVLLNTFTITAKQVDCVLSCKFIQRYKFTYIC